MPTKTSTTKKTPAAKTSKKAPVKAATKTATTKRKAPVKKEILPEFAVIATGGKQYKVAVGDVVTIEKLPGTIAVGDTITFDQVVAHDDGSSIKLGKPVIAGMKVEGKLMISGKTPKLRVQRFRSKSNYHRAYGHRQPFMKVKITSIK